MEDKEIAEENYKEKMRLLKLDASEYFMNDKRERCMLTHTTCKNPDCRRCMFTIGEIFRQTMRAWFGGSDAAR